MSKNYDQINDEEELHKLMNAAEDFDERKKIRNRLREIREKQREEYEAKKKQREAETEDLVKKRFEQAEAEKKKKMEAYKNQAPTHERDSKYHQSTEKMIQEKHRLADEEKAKKLAAYSSLSTPEKKAPGSTTTTTTTKTPAKPQPAKNAMAAFKQMDAANPGAGRGAGGPAKVNMSRSPSAIKQVMLDWAKAMTAGYPGVEVTNFSNSWNTGMAFCALIHHFYPDAFDFSTLDPKKRRYNFTLAFDTAEQKADIAPLLDVDDMVKMKNPDWKCVFTYVQSMYRHLKDHPNNKASAPPPEQ